MSFDEYDNYLPDEEFGFNFFLPLAISSFASTVNEGETSPSKLPSKMFLKAAARYC
jgi:hypothetical protein